MIKRTSCKRRYAFLINVALVIFQWRIQDLTLGGGGVDFVNGGWGVENHIKW